MGLDDWTQNLDKHCKLDVMYIDLEKAFDSLSHEKLFYELSNFGIRENLHEWICKLPYRANFCVEVDESRSATSTLISGIPQVTIFGPLLFFILINNLSDGLLISKIQFYVDVSKLYGTVPSTSV